MLGLLSGRLRSAQRAPFVSSWGFPETTAGWDVDAATDPPAVASFTYRADTRAYELEVKGDPDDGVGGAIIRMERLLQAADIAMLPGEEYTFYYGIEMPANPLSPTHNADIRLYTSTSVTGSSPTLIREQNFIMSADGSMSFTAPAGTASIWIVIDFFTSTNTTRICSYFVDDCYLEVVA